MKTLASLFAVHRYLALTFGFAIGSAANAQVLIDWQAATNFGIGDSHGTPLATGSLVKLGAFTVDEHTIRDHAGDYAFLSSNFVTVDATTVGSGDNADGIDGYWTRTSPSVSTDDLGVTGAQMYLWAFNSTTGATATEQGIFSTTTWTFPGNTSVPNTAQIDLNQANIFVIGGFGTGTSSATGSPQPLYNLAAVPAAVPEPATTAALAALSALALAWGRRRFTQQRLVQSQQL